MAAAVPKSEEGLRRAIGEAHRRYTRRVNFRKKWRGHLWQGRFASFVMDQPYLLACAGYVEMNPVRAGMVKNPNRYRWSSCPSSLGDNDDCWLDEHGCYTALGASALERRDRYIAFVEQGLPEKELLLFRTALQRGQLTGDNQFIDQVEQIIGRRIEHRAPGNQPKKPAK